MGEIAQVKKKLLPLAKHLRKIQGVPAAQLAPSIADFKTYGCSLVSSLFAKNINFTVILSKIAKKQR